MKILGFIFENKPSMAAHINHCIDKFNRAIWSLNHLRRANIENRILLQVYTVMLRPLLEYCHVIYHALITEEQSNVIERQQKRALKVIYGFDKDYGDLCSLSGLTTLQERRTIAFEKFANNLVLNERYSSWFPKREEQNRLEAV